jgi:hypothetical protein
MHAYWVSLTDGAEHRRAKIVALGAVFARMEAQRWFQGTKWRIVSVFRAQ